MVDTYSFIYIASHTVISAHFFCVQLTHLESVPVCGGFNWWNNWFETKLKVKVRKNSENNFLFNTGQTFKQFDLHQTHIFFFNLNYEYSVTIQSLKGRRPRSQKWLYVKNFRAAYLNNMFSINTHFGTQNFITVKTKSSCLDLIFVRAILRPTNRWQLRCFHWFIGFFA